VVAWLGQLPVAGRSAPGEDGRLERLLLAPLRMLAEALSGTDDQGLVARTVEEVEQLRGAPLPVVFEHGDLSHPNLVRQEDGRLVVVDWELAEPGGLPAQDLLFFLAYAAASVERAVTVQAQVRACADAVTARGGWGRHELELDAARLGYDRSLLRPLNIACWARQSAHLLVRTSTTCGTTRSPEAVAHLRASRVMALWRDAVGSPAVRWC
jgi:thiamine kinase-like enzyme